MPKIQALSITYWNRGGGSAHATWNPSDKGSGLTLSNGNLTTTYITPQSSVRSTVSKTSGKWYWEIHCDSGIYAAIGIGTASMLLEGFCPGWADAYGWSYYSGGGTGYKYHSTGGSPYGASYTAGDTIGVALDMDGGTVTFYKNNVSQGPIAHTLSGAVFAAYGTYLATVVTANFGATAMAYSPPPGFIAGLTY